MHRSVKNLQGFQIVALDGAIGSVDEFYFDDIDWVIRYLLVDTGTWLPGRQVLISPRSILQVDWAGRTVSLDLTQEQVRKSPDIDTHKPVSRQQETSFHAYYGYPTYWESGTMLAPGLFPMGVSPQDVAAENARRQAEQDKARVQGDDHLRRTKEVLGYHLQATDGELGHVADFLVDDEGWVIHYLVVNTSNWWFGNHVLVARDWITGVSWEARTVRVELTREAVQGAPPYDAAVHIDRQWEADYHRHFARSPYWSRQAGDRG